MEGKRLGAAKESFVLALSTGAHQGIFQDLNRFVNVSLAMSSPKSLSASFNSINAAHFIVEHHRLWR